MNIDEFIDKLAKMRDRKQWRLDHENCIRSGVECPISSFKDERAINFNKVADEIGLSFNDKRNIVLAADCFPADNTDEIAAVREKLLVATGLK